MLATEHQSCVLLKDTEAGTKSGTKKCLVFLLSISILLVLVQRLLDECDSGLQTATSWHSEKKKEDSVPLKILTLHFIL